MDPTTALVLVFGTAVQVLCWALPVPRMGRVPIAAVSGAAILYSVAAFGLMGANSMQIAVSRFVAVGVCVLVGAAIGGNAGEIAWRHNAVTSPSTAPAVPSSSGEPASSFPEPVISRVRKVTPQLQVQIGVADKIEYDMRGSPPRTEDQVKAYAKRIEDWRTDVDALLRREMPKSGADSKFKTFHPQVGRGPSYYEYQRLIEMRANLVSILENLESFVRRSEFPQHSRAGRRYEAFEAVFDYPRCHGCRKADAVRLGIWNSGEWQLGDVHVYLESITPGFQDKREFRWVGELRGKGININGSLRSGHSHFEFMSLISERGKYLWRLEIAGGFILPERSYVAKLVVEAEGIAPCPFEVHIDTLLDPPIVLRPDGSTSAGGTVRA